MFRSIRENYELYRMQHKWNGKNKSGISCFLKAVINYALRRPNPFVFSEEQKNQFERNLGEDLTSRFDILYGPGEILLRSQYNDKEREKNFRLPEEQKNQFERNLGEDLTSRFDILYGPGEIILREYKKGIREGILSSFVKKIKKYIFGELKPFSLSEEQIAKFKRKIRENLSPKFSVSYSPTE